jgi:hypothetical protein
MAYTVRVVAITTGVLKDDERAAWVAEIVDVATVAVLSKKLVQYRLECGHRSKEAGTTLLTRETG